MDRSGTVSSTGIARLAGVGRAAVSNWRRRHADFPPPVGGTATSPVFDLAAVQTWLSAQGKLGSAGGPERLWREIEAASEGPDLGEALWLTGLSLLCGTTTAAHREGPPAPDTLIEPVRRLDASAAGLLLAGLPVEWSPRQLAVLRAAAQLDAGADPGSAFEELCRLYFTARGAKSDFTTPVDIARLMVTLAGTATRVMDPACGSGSLIMQVLAAAGSAAPHCFVQDIDPTAARITQIRLLFARYGTGWGEPPHVVRVGDSLRVDAFPGQRVDLVISNPPFGLQHWADDTMAFDARWEYGGLPPRTESELAWVQDALAHLDPGGLAVLLMPPGAAWRPAGRRIRAELLRRGALRAVIALPPRLSPVTAIGLHVWLLRRPVAGVSAGEVLLVDAAAVTGDRSPQVRAVTETAAGAWRAFELGSADVNRPGVSRQVPVLDLLDEDVDVSPARQLAGGERTDVDASALLASRAEVISRLEVLGAVLPALAEGQDPALDDVRRVSMDELARSGTATIYRGTSRPADEASSELAVTGGDVVRGEPPSGRASASAVRVEQGDVLVPTIARSPMARVATDEQVDAYLGQNLSLIRVDPTVLDPWFVAGMLSSPVNAREAVHSSAIRDSVRVNVSRLQVPLLPLQDQRRYGEAFRQLAEFDTMLARAADDGRELARNLAEAVSGGLITLERSNRDDVRRNGPEHKLDRNHGDRGEEIR